MPSRQVLGIQLSFAGDPGLTSSAEGNSHLHQPPLRSFPKQGQGWQKRHTGEHLREGHGGFFPHEPMSPWNFLSLTDAPALRTTKPGRKALEETMELFFYSKATQKQLQIEAQLLLVA